MRLFKNVTYGLVSELIASKHIVAIFQGRSESGPRALGNRSILFDPRDAKGHLYVNEIKGREWYRPVAGTIVEEEFQNYFKTGGLKSSPFMVYAFPLIKEIDELKSVAAITHIDDTCRIQTVNEKQNFHYYNLIKSFQKTTGVPILGNTSFNLGGEPIVETLEDAISVINRSKIEFLYIPEKKSLILSENK